MKNRYEICEMQICPFDILLTRIGRYLKADRNNFPYRYCVYDKKLQKAIDVELEISYDYIEMSTVYFLGEEAKKIEEGKRYAILPLCVGSDYNSKKKYKKAKDIINRLTQGEEFIDGNIYSNEEYLDIIGANNKQKIKRK